MTSAAPFRLDPEFVRAYASREPPFGYNGLGKMVYARTYSRKLPGGEQEQWHDTVERVVNGTYTMQKRWIEHHGLGWRDDKGQRSAQEMYDLIWSMKFLPPGRGLWAMGSPLTEERHLYAALNNCAFVSTADLDKDPTGPFTFLMDASMLGVGVGFDTKGAGRISVMPVGTKGPVYTIPDSREGWVESLRRLIAPFFTDEPVYQFDYSKIRPAGTPIEGFGGLASGSGPLKQLHEDVMKALLANTDEPITVTTIVDIMNVIGKCVVAGNVRRCLPGGALVHTQDGLVPIRDVSPGQRVLTSVGFKRVTEQVYQGVQALVSIVTQDGVFRCTPTHRMAVLTACSGAYAWKRADELAAGDRLVSTRVAIPGRDTQLPTWSYLRPSANSTTCKDITPPTLDTAMSWFIGAFMCDGYTYPNYGHGGFNAYICLKFGKDQTNIAVKAKAQIQRFGVDLHVDMRDTVGEESITVRCQSKQLAWYLDKNVKQARVPLRVPQWILQATLSNRQAFVAGVLDADGCASDRPVTVLVKTYPQFVLDVQHVLYSCGVESRVALNKSFPSRGDWKPRSLLHLITRRSVGQVASFPELCKTLRIGSKSQYANGFPIAWCQTLPASVRRRYGLPQSKVQFNIDSFNDAIQATSYCPVEVLRVEQDVAEETFDISVEDQHEFFVDGLLSHNTAEIAFGEHDDKEFLNLKNYAVNPQRMAHGWVSNNSIFAEIGMNYTDVAKRIQDNGEPGLAWLDNMRAYSRMNGASDDKDHRVQGGNPCLEQSLESYELCCLVEVFPHRHDTHQEFLRTLKYAYCYAKTVTLGKTHWPQTNRVLLRNRRIGCSVSGIAQFLAHPLGVERLRQWLEAGYGTIQYYDKVYSEWLAIPRSIKTTSVKPSGTVSLLAGATPGVHFPESRFYLRRVRLSTKSHLVAELRQAGYHVEPAESDREHTVVVSFPIDVGEGVRTLPEVPMWEQLAVAALLQRHWADNQVSCTVTFDPKTEGPQIARALDFYQYQLKGVSFLPRLEVGAYTQMPYESITPERYDEMSALLTPLQLLGRSVSLPDRIVDKFCDGDLCTASLLNAAPDEPAP